jgi:uncharacterized C2H2 Zn-finger protein
MSQKGTHTWDLNLFYHRCPKCGYIIENRDGWSYRLGKYEKDLACTRCGHAFTAVKPSKPRFGPLIGEPQKPEFDWKE